MLARGLGASDEPCLGFGITSSGSVLFTRLIISEAFGLPGTTGICPDSPSTRSRSRKINEIPPASFTPPWQAVQCLRKIGRMSRLKRTSSAASRAQGRQRAIVAMNRSMFPMELSTGLRTAFAWSFKTPSPTERLGIGCSKRSLKVGLGGQSVHVSSHYKV